MGGTPYWKVLTLFRQMGKGHSTRANIRIKKGSFLNEVEGQFSSEKTLKKHKEGKKISKDYAKKPDQGRSMGEENYHRK